MDTMRCIIISSDLTPVIAAIDNYDHDSVEAKPVVGDYEKALWFPREKAVTLWQEAKQWEPSA